MSSSVIQLRFTKTSLKFLSFYFLEVAWTILPAMILMVIAVPSFALLYSLDEVIDPFFTLKVTGAQWYWHYEYSDWVINDGEEIKTLVLILTC